MDYLVLLSLPCINPKADPGRANGSPIASFLRFDSLELGLGLLEDPPPKNPPLNDVIRPLVNPSRLDCRKLAKALSRYPNVFADKSKCICRDIEMYLPINRNVFAEISKKYLPINQNVFADKPKCNLRDIKNVFVEISKRVARYFKKKVIKIELFFFCASNR